MKLQLSWVDGKPTVLLPSEAGAPERIGLSPIQVLGDDLDIFLAPLLASTSMMEVTTARLRLRLLAQTGEALQAIGCRGLPTTRGDWQKLVLDVHDFIHTRRDRSQSLFTRHISVWGSTRRCFSVLVEAGVMPVGVHIPSVETTLVIDAQQEGLLGDSDATVVDDKASIDKLLLPISLSRSDAEYLDEIRDSLLERRDVLFSCLKDYWEKLHMNLEFGRQLRESVDPDLLKECSIATPTGIYLRTGPTESLKALSVHLRILQDVYDGAPFRCRGALENRTEAAALRNSLPRVSKWPIADLLPPSLIGDSSRLGLTLTWCWLGRLSQRDVAFIMALLTMLHPRWTPGALAEARVSNRDGKLYLDLDEEGLGFEVEKRRAKAMKREVLCPLSEQILSTVLEYSSELRERLASARHPLAQRLFLPYGKQANPGTVSVSAPAGMQIFVSGKCRQKMYKWLGHLYPELERVGLTAGTISYKKIRATEGVLEWFRTKSLRAASKKIGNSRRVVLEHYIPTAIIQAWNVRAVRRFQNLWITVAAADEPFLLDVTDFASLEDLNSFIATLLQVHSPTSSPLAAELHRRFSTSDEAKTEIHSGNLHVSLSHTSLTALYQYHAAAMRSSGRHQNLKQIDPATGVSPDAFLQLADLLQTQLPVDRNLTYRHMHEAALEAAASSSQLESWAALFTQGASNESARP